VPPEFRVVALVGVYNEEDVIVPFLEYTISQGIEVHLLDNGSTDRTAERAARFLHRGLRAIEKFPESGPSPTHDWAGMLNRKAELASRTEGDWFIHLDADEIRESPWPGLTLREALCRVDREGFNAVDHACVVFHPTGGNFLEDRAIQPQFPYFEFGTRPAHFMQIKAWKRQPGPVECAESAGHAVSFPGRRVYPFKFLLRHYPIRSQQHGEKKVFVERLPRFRPVLRARGWHKQYDGISRNHAFVRDPSTLSCFSPETFYDEYMIERLSGIGIARPGNAAAPGSGYRINTGGVTAE
jgi:glycosyltransferase involved in cell wall biosynthesis